MNTRSAPSDTKHKTTENSARRFSREIECATRKIAAINAMKSIAGQEKETSERSAMPKQKPSMEAKK
jgi:hypothetical protein